MNTSAAALLHRAPTASRPAHAVAAKPVTVKPTGGGQHGDDRSKAAVASKLQTPKPGQKVNGAVYL